MSTDFPQGSTNAETTLVDTLGDGSAERRRELMELDRGTVLGRYVILGRIGAGGMGVVFAAYDPELDRKVAIKLLVTGEGGTSGTSTGGGRLLREAQALAKLSHPNVVAIHDVGTMEERVWLAMEFVEGDTLGQWLAATKRTWREIRHVLDAAGRGLAAAHAKGMLHRDFKPDNVMVGRDGRVRVMDFGLARARDDHEGPRSALLLESSVREAAAIASERAGESYDPKLLDSQMTQAGALLGTPAYLAPEVFAGDQWSAAADQFAFCVTLWEALYGQRPFEGVNLVELATHVLEGTMRAPPRGSGVPGWLRKVCLRGLAGDPARRWPSMVQLLDSLERDPRRARVRVGLGVAAAATIGGAWVWQDVAAKRSFAACEARGEAVQEVWNPKRREWLRAAVGAGETASPYALGTANRVVGALDAYALRWTADRASTCVDPGAGEVGHDLSAELETVQAQCFDARLDAMETLIDVLGSAEGDLLRHAVVAAIELPASAECLDGTSLRSWSLSTTSADRQQVDELRRELLTARVLLGAVQLEEAAEHAERASVAAEAIGAEGLAAEAGYLIGAIAHASGQFAEAEQMLRRAYFDAFAVGREDVAASAAVALTSLNSVGRVQLELADVWLGLARGLDDRMRRTDRVDPVIRAELTTAAAFLATEKADYEEAESQFRQAIALREDAYGSAHPDIGLMYGHLAELFDDSGDFASAEAAGNKGLALLETSLGPSHPDNSQALFALATAAWKTGRGEQSLALSERALKLRLGAFGPDHVLVAEALNSVGNAHIQLGDWHSAHEAHGRALEIRRLRFGPDEPRVATSLVNLADVAVHVGRVDEGIEHARGSLRIWEEKLGVDHPYCAYAHIVVGEGAIRAGRFEEALAGFDRGLEIRRAAGEAEHQLAEPLTGRGEALLGLGRTDEALVALEAAWEIRERHPSSELHAPDTGFVLARGLWARDGEGDRARAVEIAKRARRLFEEVAVARPEGLVVVDEWIRAHPVD